MSNEPLFNYGEIVRLKKDLENTNLKTDAYGIVWAVYTYLDETTNEILAADYEGSFWDSNGNYDDIMFEENDAEKVFDLKKVPFTEDMKKLWIYLNQKEN